MNVGLDDLYREVILDHYRNPHGAEAVKDPVVEVEVILGVAEMGDRKDRVTH